MNVIDDFAKRLLDIISEIEGTDVREEFRRKKLYNLCKKIYPHSHDITIIGIVDRLYCLLYNHEE